MELLSGHFPHSKNRKKKSETPWDFENMAHRSYTCPDIRHTCSMQQYHYIITTMKGQRKRRTHEQGYKARCVVSYLPVDNTYISPRWPINSGSTFININSANPGVRTRPWWHLGHISKKKGIINCWERLAWVGAIGRESTREQRAQVFSQQKKQGCG